MSSESDTDSSLTHSDPPTPSPTVKHLVHKFNPPNHPNHERLRPHPRWFSAEEDFKYDSTLAVAFAPPALVALSLVGETILVALGLGVLLCHLLMESGYERRAFAVAVATFLMVQFSLVFSIFPLIWTSVSYVLFLLLFNSFTVSSALWFFLHFRIFRAYDPEFTVVTERLLIGVFPAISLAIQSWTFASFASVTLLPYYVLVVGFVFSSIFLRVRPSSFCRREYEDSLCLPPLALPAEAIVVASAFFALIPASVFLLVFISSGLFNDWIFYLQFCFLLSVGIFLTATIFGVQDVTSYLTHLNLTTFQVQMVRGIAGGNSLLCGYLWLVKELGGGSVWLAWLPLFVCVHVGVAAAAKQRSRKIVFVACFLFVLAYAAFFIQLPLLRRAGGLHFSLGEFRLSARILAFLMFLLAISGMVAFVHLPSLRTPANILPLTFHSALFAVVELCLFHSRLYPVAFGLVSSFAAILAHARMMHLDLASRTGTSASLGIICAKTYALMMSFFGEFGDIFSTFVIVWLVTMGALWIHSWVKSDGDKKLILTILAVLQLIIHFVFIRPLWLIAFDLDMSLGDCIFAHILIGGLTLRRIEPEKFSPPRYAGTIFLAIAVFLVQPSLEPNFHSIFSWIRLIGIAGSLHFFLFGVELVSQSRNLIPYAYATGVPLATEVLYRTENNFVFDGSFFLYGLTLVISSALVLGLVSPLLSRTKAQNRFLASVAPKLLATLVATVVLTSAIEKRKTKAARRWDYDGLVAYDAPSILSVAAIFFPLIAALVKLQQADKDMIESGLFDKKLTAFGRYFNAKNLSNCLVAITIIIDVLIVDWSHLNLLSHHLVYLIVALHAMLIQPENVIFKALPLNLGSSKFIIFLSTFLYCSLCSYSAIRESSFWHAKGSISAMVGFCELSFITLSFPLVFLIFFFENGKFLFVLPCAIVLFFLSSSSWAKIISLVELGSFFIFVGFPMIINNYMYR